MSNIQLNDLVFSARAKDIPMIVAHMDGDFIVCLAKTGCEIIEMTPLISDLRLATEAEEKKHNYKTPNERSELSWSGKF